MRSRIALLLVVAAAGLGGTAAAPLPVDLVGAAQASHCKRGYVDARLSWGHKCLRAGQFCKVGNRQYAKYGFVCPPSGHLRRK